jgi:hypothetical protein
VRSIRFGKPNQPLFFSGGIFLCAEGDCVFSVSEKNEHWGGRSLLGIKSVIHGLKTGLGLRPSTSCILFFFLFLLLLPLSLVSGPWVPLADAATVTLGWDSNPEPDLEGYVIYRNTASPGPPYDDATTLPEDDLTDPLHPEVTLTGLKKDQEYYIALTAYNTEGVESSFSNDVCVEVVNNIAEPCAASTIPVASKSSSGGGGGGGNSCFITTTSHKSSMFAELIAKPAIFSPLLVRVLLCLILIGAFTLGFKKAGK